MKEKLSIVILTSYEGFFSKVFWEELILHLKLLDKIIIKHVFFLNFKNRTKLNYKVHQFFVLFSFGEILKLIFFELLNKINNCFNLLNIFNVPFSIINKDDYHYIFKNIKRNAPIDLIISFNNPLILKNDILSIPRISAVNIHNGKLPTYRGLYTPIWQILNNEKEIVVTAHTMTPVIDIGRIIFEEILPIQDKSLLEIFLELRKLDAFVVYKVLKEVRKDDFDLLNLKILKNEGGKYYKTPTFKDLKKVKFILKSKNTENE